MVADGPFPLFPIICSLSQNESHCFNLRLVTLLFVLKRSIRHYGALMAIVSLYSMLFSM